MKRKSFILFAALITMLSLVGCGDGEKEPVKTGDNVSVNKTDMKEKDKSDKGNEIKDNVEISEKGMKIPEEFPSDIVPILGDGKVTYVIKNSENNAINVTYTTGNSIEDAATFYKEVLKDSSDIQEISSEDSYILVGSKEGYVVTITIVAPNDETTVQIDTRPE